MAGTPLRHLPISDPVPFLLLDLDRPQPPHMFLAAFQEETMKWFAQAQQQEDRLHRLSRPRPIHHPQLLRLR